MWERQVMQATLRELAAAVEGRLWEQVRQRIGLAYGRFDALVDWVAGEYADEARRRWYDPLHIAYSTSFALDLVDAGQADPLLIPAILLHDMGYFAITDKDAWNRPEVRITHMQEGAALAAEILCRQRFTPSEVGHIVGLVATHDNPYLGYPLHGTDRLALRDCDRVWVMHLVSFYKDWSSKQPPDRNVDPRRLLAVRRVHFCGVEATRKEPRWGADEDVLREAGGRVEVPFLAAARERIDRLFERRAGELAQEGLWHSPDRFLEYAQEVIGGE